MALPASRLTLRRAWAPVTLRSTMTDIPAERIRRWLEDLPPPIGYSVRVRMRTRRDVIRFLYCHEFYHWYLWEVRGEKSSAETACDRFALAHFRKQHRHTDWEQELPGYSFQRRRLRRAA